jgi:pyruvate/2-oxoglutarate dehydrogenase complex dihydrolipoamide acyltransferase (E2) component
VPRSPRHRHSPRIRRAAADHALTLAHLDGLTGSGRKGRLTVHDVVRAAERRTQDTAGPATTGEFATALATALVEVDVTRVRPDRFLPAAVRALADAAIGIGPARVQDGVFVVPGDGERRLVHDAADLTVDGIRRRLAGEDEDPGPAWTPGARLAVVDVASRGVLLDTAGPPEGVRIALGVGAPAERPAVVHDADGRPSIAVRSIAYLTLTYDPAVLTSADAGRLLSDTARRLVTV